MGRYHDIPLDGDDDDDSCSTVQLKSPAMQCVSTPSPGQSWASVPQSQPPPSDSNWLQSIKHMMSDMTNDMTCNTRDMLGNIRDRLQKQRSADIAETRDMLGGIQNTLQAQIDVVISDARTEAGQRSSDIAKMYQATRETCDKLNNVECNMTQLESTMMNEIQFQMSVVNANADKIREATRQVLCDFGMKYEKYRPTWPKGIPNSGSGG